MSNNKIESFNFRSLVPNPNILIVSNNLRHVHLIDTLVGHLNSDCTKLYAIATNSQINLHLRTKYSDIAIREDSDDQFIREILAEARGRIIHNCQNNSILILDHSLPKNKDFSTDLTELLMNGRHYRVSIIIVTDNLDLISPDILNQFDYVFPLIDSANEKIYHYFSDCFQSKEQFKLDYDVLTEQNRNTVIDTVRKGLYCINF